MGNGQPPIAAIQITLTPGGAVVVQANVPSRPVFNMMMETAKQDMLEKFRVVEQGPRVQVAPPGSVVQ